MLKVEGINHRRSISSLSHPPDKENPFKSI